MRCELLILIIIIFICVSDGPEKAGYGVCAQRVIEGLDVYGGVTGPLV